jgi:hypothetical protein
VGEGGAGGARLVLPVSVEERVFGVLGGQLVWPSLLRGVAAGREVGGRHVR